ELGDSAYDDKDGIITSKVVIDTSKVKLTQIGTYQVTYSVKDSAGNADTVTRSVQINGNAPVIGTTSGNKETCINVAAVFWVSATGSPLLKYQWMKGTAAAPGTSTDSTYTITPLSAADAGSFYCVVSNGISPDAQSQNMTLTVDSPPAISSITVSPSAMPVCSGTQVAFTVSASGAAPLIYTWKKNGSAVTNGPNNAVYTITSVAVTDSGQYSCTVSNGCTPSATSSNVHLTVSMPPTISAPATNTTISKIVGDTVTLTVTASGTGTLSYQWYKGSTTMGTNSSTLPIKPIAFADSGAYTCAVSNGCGSVTSKIITLSVSSRPTITTQPKSQTLYLNQSTTFTVAATGVPQPTYQWRKNGTVINNATSSSFTIPSPVVSDSGKYTVTVTNSIGSLISDTARFYAQIKTVSTGQNHNFILKTDGTVWAFGANFNGQLGDGTTTNRLAPVQISISNVQSVAAGWNHSLFLKTDGSLWACGSNSNGQLGDGTTTNHSTPFQVTSNVLSMAAGGLHSLIIKSGGTLWSCGSNSNGQLGDATTTDRLTFVPVTSLSNVKSLAAGYDFSLIVRSDGTLWVCGDNVSGQLGDGTSTDRSMPAQVMTMSNVQSAAAGESHSLFLKTNGTLWSCGNNIFGQLGDGTNNNHLTPIQVGSINNVLNIAIGANHSLIMKTDSTLWVCGWNAFGQLGDGTTNNKSTFEQVTSIAKAYNMTAGEEHSLFLKSDNTLSACGDNSSGQLGNGTTNGQLTPTNVLFQ
ncbi:MAG: immunoglobulin domain-containing protein, partial [Chitinivibrionales bacterium]